MAGRRFLIGSLTAFSLTATCWAGADLDQMATAIVGATQSSDHTSFINDNFAKDVAVKLSPEAEDGVDFDVLTYSQDPDYEQIRKTIRSEVREADATRAIIRVTFTQYDAEGLVEYHLKKAGERWVIDDVVYPNDEYALRSGLGLK